MNARDRILARLTNRPNPSTSHPKYEASSSALHPIEQFEERFLFHLGEIWTWTDLNAWTEHTAFFDQGAENPNIVPFPKATRHVWEAELAITKCNRLIAETGTIVIEATPCIHRLASLCPEIHVVTASKSQVVATIDEALATQSRANTVWITGPSRTADIEGILVPGIHGPKRVALVWID